MCKASWYAQVCYPRKKLTLSYPAYLRKSRPLTSVIRRAKYGMDVPIKVKCRIVKLYRQRSYDQAKIHTSSSHPSSIDCSTVKENSTKWGGECNFRSKIKVTRSSSYLSGGGGICLEPTRRLQQQRPCFEGECEHGRKKKGAV